MFLKNSIFGPSQNQQKALKVSAKFFFFNWFLWISQEFATRIILAANFLFEFKEVLKWGASFVRSVNKITKNWQKLKRKFMAVLEDQIKEI